MFVCGDDQFGNIEIHANAVFVCGNDQLGNIEIPATVVFVCGNNQFGNIDIPANVVFVCSKDRITTAHTRFIACCICIRVLCIFLSYAPIPVAVLFDALPAHALMLGLGGAAV